MKNTKKITMLGMLAALAFLAVALIRVPVVEFLKYEPKDVIIAIGGFVFGPMSAFLLSAVVSLVEMVTISDTGIIGCLMNILSSSAFACTAALIYKRWHTLKGAVIGLGAGCLTATAVMLLWNFLITPLYMGISREAVTAMLALVFLPFNLLKGALNAGLILLIYKPLVGALRRANLLENPTGGAPAARSTGMLLLALALVATCVALVLVWQGVL